MAKKDYLLERALQGDLDAIENVLGQVYAPLFDLGYHALGRAEATEDDLVAALHELARELRGGSLSAPAPFLVAARAYLGRLAAALPPTLGSESPLLAGLESAAALALLGRTALDLDGIELDLVLDLAAARGEDRAAAALAGLGLAEDDFRDRLDEVSAGVALPAGLIERALDRLDED